MFDTVNLTEISTIQRKTNEFQLLFSVSEKLDILDITYKRNLSARYNDLAPNQCYVQEDTLQTELYFIKEYLKECGNCNKGNIYISKLNIINCINSINGIETIDIVFYCPDCQLEFRLYDDWSYNN